MNIVTHFTQFDSPVGKIILTARNKKLIGLHLADHEHSPAIQADWVENAAEFSVIKKQLDDYFAGRLQAFDLPFTSFELKGTPFQIKVWEELYKIPYGETISYKELADRVGSPNAVRAVGSANGKNPISIIIPCHRVIASSGGLGGYGWGLGCKQELLTLERKYLASS